jgi:hypothetical protein
MCDFQNLNLTADLKFEEMTILNPPLLIVRCVYLCTRIGLLISKEIINMKAAKKRRVIKDDDDEGNDENEPKLEVNQQQQQAQAENDKRNYATSMVDRLKRRAAKTKAVAQEKSTIKRMKVEPCTAEATPTSVATIKKEQSIPKKPKRITQTQTLTIPKKSNDDAKIKSNNTPNDKIKMEATTTPSLLSTMKKPPTSSNKSKNNKSFPPPTSRGRSTSPPRSNVVNLTRSPGPPSVDDDKNGVDVVEKEVLEENDKLGSGLRQMVWDGLRDTCKTIFPIPPIRDGIDLQASFLRHKDLNISTNIDTISSSNSTNQRYDFFDIDETNGNIVMQTKIPIFPEDFPPGVKEWPLSWWGIVDPSIGERRVEVKSERNKKIDIKKEQRTKPKREATPVAKKSADQPKGDRNRRDNTNSNTNSSYNKSDSSGRKRSSRDRHEDEPLYYDDYHHRGNGGGGGGGGSGGNPPSFHGNNFRNHPHDRGGGGGPPFPNRMGDGPHNNNNHPRYGPPTGDFRGGGGGGRPHPTHGGGGGGGGPPPRNYPPQGGRRPDERRGRR